MEWPSTVCTPQGGKLSMDTPLSFRFAPATPSERAELLALVRANLADRCDQIMAAIGLTWPQFEELYASRGEVRTLRCGDAAAGYCWIEERDRTLHLHALFVLPEEQGRGVGSAALRGLADEFRDRVDAIELGVEQANRRARALYERHGFRVEETLPELGFFIMRKRCVVSGGCPRPRPSG